MAVVQVTIRAQLTGRMKTLLKRPQRSKMVSRALFATLMSALAPTTRYRDLFAMSDRQLAVRGYDRAGLARSHVTGIAGF